MMKKSRDNMHQHLAAKIGLVIFCIGAMSIGAFSILGSSTTAAFTFSLALAIVCTLWSVPLFYGLIWNNGIWENWEYYRHAIVITGQSRTILRSRSRPEHTQVQSHVAADDDAVDLVYQIKYRVGRLEVTKELFSEPILTDEVPLIQARMEDRNSAQYKECELLVVPGHPKSGIGRMNRTMMLIFSCGQVIISAIGVGVPVCVSVLFWFAAFQGAKNGIGFISVLIVSVTFVVVSVPRVWVCSQQNPLFSEFSLSLMDPTKGVQIEELHDEEYERI